MRSSGFKRGSIRVFATVGVLAAASQAHSQGLPLPTAGQLGLVPVVWFVLDNSVSMTECDGGLYDENNRPVPSSLFDPKSNDGTASKGDSGTRDEIDAFATNGCDTDGDGDATDQRSGSTYQLSRLEAVKLAMAQILDANDDGVINASDESVLNIKAGIANYDVTGTYRMATSGTTYATVGSSFATIWAAVKAFDDVGTDTPHIAIGGARAQGLAKCWDSTPGGCALPTGEQDATDGDDLYANCRNYYVIHLTDGQPFRVYSGTEFRTDFQGVDIAKSLRNQQALSGASEPAYVTTAPVKTLAIGIGAAFSSPGGEYRGDINCQSFWGGDANADDDGNALTMDDDTDGSTAGVTIDGSSSSTSDGDYCNARSNFTSSSSRVQRHYGNGFFATNAEEIATSLRSALNAIGVGTFSGSQPIAVNTGATSAGRAVYGAYFEVIPGKPDWRGHLRKYRFDPDAASGAGAYVDCDLPGTTSTPVKPCWDAGGRAVFATNGTVSFSSFANESGVNTTNLGLYDRNWRTRRIFIASTDVPSDTNVLDYEKSLTNEKAIAHEPAYAGRTVMNLVTPLDGFGTFPPTVASVTGLATGSPTLFSAAAYSMMSSSTQTFDVGDTIPGATLTSALNGFYFAVGRPDSTFFDGTKRCGSGACTPDTSTPSPKLGDSFHSRPVLVGPPAGLVTDTDYYSEFLERSLAATAFTPALENVVETDLTTSADPCAGVTPCKVKNRRKVVYLASNDGMVHAFDDKTGHELWAYIPVNHLPNLDNMRAGRRPMIDANPLVRDVKFPLETGKRNADGKWHTILVYTTGLGGNFVFALDITNPTDPKFLWEYRKPDRMGFTIARAAIGQIPSGAGNDGEPGAAVFVSGGITEGTAAAHPHFFTLRPHRGEKLADKHTDPQDLADSETALAVINGMTGEPRPVDGNQDGTIERVYFGDREGRLWKICDITQSGDFTFANDKPFFDPALYDNPTNGGATEAIGEVKDKALPLTGVTDFPTERKQLRGPIYFPPDITRDINDNLVVGFGSGDLNDPLEEPSNYKNFIWVVKDDSNSSGDCSFPTASVCTAAAGSHTIGSKTFTNVRKLNDYLSAAPLFFNRYLFYAEFDVTSGCPSSYNSRLYAVDAFTCGTPGVMPFTVSGSPANVITYANELVTGISIDPKGYVTAQGSRPAGNPPGVQKIPGISVGAQYVGFRQLN